MARSNALGFTVVLLASACWVQLYAEQTPLSPEDVLSYRSLSGNQKFGFAPNGRSLIYAVRNTEPQLSWSAEAYEKTGVPQHAVGSSIWLVDTTTGHNEQISPDKVDAWAPTWSPDGQSVAYLSDHDPDHMARIWIYDSITGRNRRVSDLVVCGAYSLQWTPDGKEFVVEALSGPGKRPHDIYAVTGSGIHPASESTARVYVSNTAGEQVDNGGPWRIGEGQGALALVNVKNGQVSWVTKNKAVANFWVSPDGSFVAFTTAKRFEKEGSQQLLFDLSVFGRDSGETRLLATEIRLSYNGDPITWSPDNTRLAFMEDGPEGLGEGFVVNVCSGATQKITSFGKVTPSPYLSGGVLWNSRSEWVYFRYSWTLWRARADGGGASQLAQIPDHRLDLVSKDGYQIWTVDDGRSVMVSTQRLDSKSCGIFRVDATTGTYVKLFERNQTIGGRRCLATDMVVSPDQRYLAFRSQDAVHEEEIWVSDARFRDARQLTHVNPQFESHDLGSAQLVQWHSIDGELLHGALLLPATYRAGKKYPLLVWIYGGAFLSDQINVFGVIGDFAGSGFLHLFTTRGYAVLGL